MPLLKLELKLKRGNAYILRLICDFQKKKMDFFNKRKKEQQNVTVQKSNAKSFVS